MRSERAAAEKAIEENAGEKPDGEPSSGEHPLESAPYSWDVTVEDDKNLTEQEEILIRGGNREHKKDI